jgi:hypothetical protein
MLTWGFGDLYVAVYPDAELAPQNIDLFRPQRPDVLSNGFEAGEGA